MFKTINTETSTTTTTTPPAGSNSVWLQQVLYPGLYSSENHATTCLLNMSCFQPEPCKLISLTAPVWARCFKMGDTRFQQPRPARRPVFGHRLIFQCKNHFSRRGDTFWNGACAHIYIHFSRSGPRDKVVIRKNNNVMKQNDVKGASLTLTNI